MSMTDREAIEYLEFKRFIGSEIPATCDDITLAISALQEREERRRLCEQTKNYDGLKPKYMVFKTKDNTLVDNCFVLRPDRDYAAREALRAYAVVTDNLQLAHDILCWVGGEEEADMEVSDNGGEENAAD